MSQRLKTGLVWLSLVAVLLGLALLTRDAPLRHEGFDVFLADVDGGVIREVRIESNQIAVTRWDGDRYRTLGVVDDALTRQLSAAGAVVAWGEAERPLRTLLLVGVPLLVLVVLFLFFLKKGSGGSMQSILSLKKSGARRIEDSTVTFADVGGCDEAKAHLSDVIDFLRDPARFADAGVRLPRGVLLEGPPGCGKTLLARAVAGETDAGFYLISASEFVEMFVGVGAARVRDLFETAGRNAPAVIFIDELDAVGRRRGSGIGAAHDEREQTLNQILVCMDGFESRERVVVIAATNRADILDPALLRPGRFDRRVTLPELGREQRMEVLRIHLAGKPVAEDLSLEAVADRTAGFCGARLESLVNEAGLRAVRRARLEGGEPRLGAADLEAAILPAGGAERRFDQLDALILESTSQLAQATGKTRVRLTLEQGTLVEGELVWADAGFVKVRGEDGAGALIAKGQIRTLEALEGTEWVESAELRPDRFSGRAPGLA